MSSPSETHDSIFGAEYRVLTIGVISVMSIIAFEAMGVITAMPTAARDLDGLDLYAWGSTAVMAASLFATAAAGGWADRKGPVPPLAAGLAGFMFGLRVRHRADDAGAAARPGAARVGIWCAPSWRSTSSSDARFPNTCDRECSPACPVPGSFQGSPARWSPDGSPKCSAGGGSSSGCCC